MSYRTPIVSVLGHTDHGKTTLLDYITGRDKKKEAGGITQHIGATEVKKPRISKLSNVSEEKMSLPGLLFIDTPGHNAFTSIRDRGVSLSDMVVLVVDVRNGFQPQTEEAIKFVREKEVPFVLVANKIDAIGGWNDTGKLNSKQAIEAQSDRVIRDFYEYTSEMIGSVAEYGMNASLLWDVDSFTDTVPIIPASATEGIGVGEILATLMGVSQSYQKSILEIGEQTNGVVLEKNMIKGRGYSIDMILKDGKLSVGDEIYFGGMDRIVSSTVRGIRYNGEDVDSVTASAGIRLFGSDLKEAVPGGLVSTDCSIVSGVNDNIRTDDDGIVVCADTVGSGEAIVKELRDRNIEVMKIGIGHIKTDDIVVASTSDSPKERIVIGFNTEPTEKARKRSKEEDIHILTGNVIYELVEEFEEYINNIESKESASARIIEGSIFRESNPLIIGCEIENGEIRTGYDVIANNGNRGRIKEIEKNGESVKIARKGDQVGISISDLDYNDVEQGDVLEISQ